MAHNAAGVELPAFIGRLRMSADTLTWWKNDGNLDSRRGCCTRDRSPTRT